MILPVFARGIRFRRLIRRGAGRKQPSQHDLFQSLFAALPGFRWVTPKSTSARPVISQAAISVSTGPRLPKVAAWAASVAEIGLARLQRSEIPGRP